MSKKKFYFTVDFDWIPGSEKSMNKLFAIVDRYKLKPTFFFAGKFADNYHDILQESAKRGFKIGSHGLNHGKDPFENFGQQTSLSTQRKILYESTEIITKICGTRPKVFRAPRMNISDNTFVVLDELDYEVDSSIPSCRFDFGKGSINQFRYFFRPNRPFDVCIDGMQNTIKEIPPSSFIFPLNMRLLRIFDMWFVKSLLSIIESKSEHIVFYMHPTEFVSPENLIIPQGENLSFYKNCSPTNFEILEKFISYISKKGFEYEFI